MPVFEAQIRVTYSNGTISESAVLRYTLVADSAGAALHVAQGIALHMSGEAVILTLSESGTPDKKRRSRLTADALCVGKLGEEPRPDAAAPLTGPPEAREACEAVRSGEPLRPLNAKRIRHTARVPPEGQEGRGLDPSDIVYTPRVPPAGQEGRGLAEKHFLFGDVPSGPTGGSGQGLTLDISGRPPITAGSEGGTGSGLPSEAPQPPETFPVRHALLFWREEGQDARGAYYGDLCVTVRPVAGEWFWSIRRRASAHPTEEGVAPDKASAFERASRALALRLALNELCKQGSEP